jgi:hypothetical protein
MKNFINTDYYGYAIGQNQRKTDITAQELKELDEKREYKQAVTIGIIIMASVITLGLILSQFQGNVY